jgi:rubrerythrin
MTYPTEQQPGFEEALDVAMEAELRAQAFYAQAAVTVQDPHGRDLLARLSAFEQHHYEQLTKLAHSLQAEGQFIEYQARSIEQFNPQSSGYAVAVDTLASQRTVLADLGDGEAVGTGADMPEDVPGILGRAIDNEKIAGERYRVLAEGTTDPTGQDMFRKLAYEESIHQRLLEDEFFSLSNRGVWAWSGLYGE